MLQTLDMKWPGAAETARTLRQQEVSPVSIDSVHQPDSAGNPITEHSMRAAFLEWCEDCEAIKHGLALPGPDGFSHYRYAYDKIIDSFRLDRGPGLALTWLQGAMPTYRMILSSDEADTFEATITAVCAEQRERQRAAEGWL
jgi:hypothetical protein